MPTSPAAAQGCPASQRLRCPCMRCVHAAPMHEKGTCRQCTVAANARPRPTRGACSFKSALWLFQRLVQSGHTSVREDAYHANTPSLRTYDDGTGQVNHLTLGLESTSLSKGLGCSIYPNESKVVSSMLRYGRVWGTCGYEGTSETRLLTSCRAQLGLNMSSQADLRGSWTLL